MRLVACASVIQLTAALEHTAFVDHDPNTGNLLFRTGSPLVHRGHHRDKDIDFEPLMSQFKTAAENAGVKWPADFFVQDFSLWTTETETIAHEKAWWEKHSELGNVTHWPIYGMHHSTLEAGCKHNSIEKCTDRTKQPNTMADADVGTLGKTFLAWGDTDDLHSRLATINGLLHTKMSKPQVIFFHCTCGCDRTGEFGIAYSIKYQSMTWTDAMAYDVKLIKRNPTYSNMVMSQWYCEYLANTGQYSHTDCGNCNPFQCAEGTDESVTLFV